jgi:glycolate oxidase
VLHVTERRAVTRSDERFLAALADAMPADALLTEVPSRYTHDEALGVEPVTPLAVALPGDETQIARLVALCRAHARPLVPRGGGTGLAGGALPHPNGIVVSLERMARVIEVDEDAGWARVQPGITLADLDDALVTAGLCYPVYPGELSSTVGGNVATNAGGMRAVRFGTTRHNVLGLRLVTGGGDLVSTHGPLAKYSSGYDLTQLVIGSEGTLGLVTEVTVRLRPRAGTSALLVGAFGSLTVLPRAVARLLASGLEPALCEYVDSTALTAMAEAAGLALGIPPSVAGHAQAYLIVEVDASDDDLCELLAARAGELLLAHGALEVFQLQRSQAEALIAARERAFWTVKALGAQEILDMVVPRSHMAELLEAAQALQCATGVLIAGTGHVGDGNVHFSILAPEQGRAAEIAHTLIARAISLGGAVSGEHGIGVAKRDALLAHEDPTRVALQRAIKHAFDPDGICNPGKGAI